MPPIGYSTNLHPAETADEIAAALDRFAGPLRVELGWDRLGVDLRLGSAALGDPAALGRLRRTLDRHRLSAHTINGFPLRAFQAPRVKEQAYLPDWTDPERLSASLALLDAAFALGDEAEVTISTCPGTYRPLAQDAAAIDAVAAALGRWAAAAARRRRDIGRTAVLCLEPEPWCLLAHDADVAWFWRGPLAGAGLAACAAALDGDAAAARDAMARHLGVCVDTCHLSLAFRDQAAAVRTMAAAGARIAKCQVSAAPAVAGGDAAGIARLRPEPRFLHQTAAARRLADGSWGSMALVEDLDRLAELRARLPDADEIRSHFHVPLTLAAGTTAADSRAGLAACRAAGCAHIAVETYTWPILAADEAAQRAGTRDELRWLAAALA